MTDLGWAGLRSAAVVGTARRPVPLAPAGAVVGASPRASASPEIRLLDQAALVGAALRTGRPTGSRPLPAVAPSDEGRAPTALQTQLLSLTVHQPPAGARLRFTLLQLWCERAAQAGVHAPHALLPDLLALATTDRSLRPAVRPTLDRRGTWLAAQNPEWRWALPAGPGEGDPTERPTGPGAGDPAEQPTRPGAGDPTGQPTRSGNGDPSERPTPDWAHLPSAERPARLRSLRAQDPDAARTLLAGTWATESARDRAALVAEVVTGLSPADEELLEAALDDPSRPVREQAARVLTRLPGSARAARMRARLAPLVTQRGVLHKEIVVALPGEPDPAGVRDGLSTAPAGRSQRAWWLHQLVTGTPLTFWTELTGADPRTVLARVRKDDGVLQAIIEAAVLQRDPVWAQAVADLAQGPELSRLLALLPGPVVESATVELLDRADADRLRRHVSALPELGPDLSRRLVARMADPRLGPRRLLRDQEVLTRLHPACLPELIALSRRTDLDPLEHRHVTELVQLLSVRRSISEAFL